MATSPRIPASGPAYRQTSCRVYFDALGSPSTVPRRPSVKNCAWCSTAFTHRPTARATYLRSPPRPSQGMTCELPGASL